MNYARGHIDNYWWENAFCNRPFFTKKFYIMEIFNTLTLNHNIERYTTVPYYSIRKCQSYWMDNMNGMCRQYVVRGTSTVPCFIVFNFPNFPFWINVIIFLQTSFVFTFLLWFRIIWTNRLFLHCIESPIHLVCLYNAPPVISFWQNCFWKLFNSSVLLMV